MFEFNRKELAALDNNIRTALYEDIRRGDITTNAAVPQHLTADAIIKAKSTGVAAGLFVCARVFKVLDREMEFKIHFEEAEVFEKGSIIMEIKGTATMILRGERTALNIMARMSGIATLTRKFVEAIDGTGVKILDTRKTVPLLRMLDKLAVRIGGAENHRFGLYDQFLIKENHIMAAGTIGTAIHRCQQYRKKRKLDAPIIVEVSNMQDTITAVDFGADRLLLDNMKPEKIREIVEYVDGKTDLEVSGGITLKNILNYANTGVNYISVGMLTHSAPAMDFSLLFQR